MRLLCLLIAAYMRLLCHNIIDYFRKRKIFSKIIFVFMLETASRLEIFFAEINEKVSHVERTIQKSNGSLSTAFKRKSSIGSDILEKIVENYPINPVWLLTGKGDMMLDGKSELVADPAQTYTKPSTASPEAEIITLQRKVIANLEEQMEKQKAANLLVGEMLLKLDGDIYAMVNPQRQPFENLALKKEMIRVGLIKASVV